MQIMVPVLGGAGSLIMIVANRNPIMLVAGGLLLAVTIIGALGMFVAQRTGAARRTADQRRRYLDYLDQVRRRLAEVTAEQREAAITAQPDPAALSALTRDPLRVWERRPGDADFLALRVGLGTGQLWTQVTAAPPRDPLAEPDVVTTAGLQRIISRDRLVSGMPVVLPLGGQISVVGPQNLVRPVITVALAQLAAWHSPDDVHLYLCVPRTSSQWLSWTVWLPHLLSSTELDGVAPARRVADDPQGLATLLAPELSRRIAEVTRTPFARKESPSRLGPALVVLMDRTADRAVDLLAGFPADLSPADIGLHIITVVSRLDAEPSRVDVRLTVADRSLQVEDLRPTPGDDEQRELRRRIAGAGSGEPDSLDPGSLIELAGYLAGIRLVEDRGSDSPMSATLSLEWLTGVGDLAGFDPRTVWRSRGPSHFLRVPFGVGPAGEKVVLDLKEPALGGMGPHGLCVGATGSGKSEVLRTLVLALAMDHPPERLAMVLVDYKGGATFAGLEGLPHCAAMISNLSDDTGLVDRLHDALFGEMKRRQQTLADAGNLANITEYNRHRDAGQNLDPLPNLFVVIDEFGELLTAKPDFIELFLAIGRIGRSIGIHLLLASQRLEEGRLRGLESFLSYRLGLRTFNVNESRSVLGVPDAYELPSIPGSGYLKVDTTVFQRFKAGYVGGPYVPPELSQAPVDAPAVAAPYLFFNDSPAATAVIATDDRSAVQPLGPSVLDIVVQRLAGVGTRTGQIWLPPLPNSLTLSQVSGPVQVHPAQGLRYDAGAGTAGTLRVPVGLLDRPSEQRQEPLMIDLAASGGHLAILGAPQSGKSGLLRTLVTSLALANEPGEIAVYCLDLGGGALRSLEKLPHVAGVAPRLDSDRVRRTVAEITTTLAARESLFAAQGIDSVEHMRQRFRDRTVPGLEAADIILVVDNYPVLRSDFEDLADMLTDIAARGAGYGIHLVLTAGRWADIKMQVQATIGTKIELRLNDSADSSISRKLAANLRADTPGRCLNNEELIAQVCLPVLDGIGDTTEDLVAAVAAAWPGDPVQPLRMLPLLVDQRELANHPRLNAGVVIGIDETDLRPVELDLWGSDRHLLILGDAESGKTGLLRGVIDDLVGRYTDNEVVFGVFDIRRTLLDIVPEDYLGAYAGTASMASGVAAGIAGECRKRLPPDDVTAAQLRDRSWWKGPEIVIIADDYDLLATGGGPGPLAPFLEFLPQARDVGLHLVIARRSGGAGRALYEPLLQRMREVGSTTLLLSGDRAEGAIFPGTYLSLQPPGRGTLVRRGRKPTLIQLGWLEEP